MYDMKQQYRSLQNERDELEQAIDALAAALRGTEADAERQAEQRDELAWLQRQHTGVLVTLIEVERALLASGADDWGEA